MEKLTLINRDEIKICFKCKQPILDRVRPDRCPVDKNYYCMACVKGDNK